MHEARFIVGTSCSFGRITLEFDAARQASDSTPPPPRTLSGRLGSQMKTEHHEPNFSKTTKRKKKRKTGCQEDQISVGGWRFARAVFEAPLSDFLTAVCF